MFTLKRSLNPVLIRRCSFHIGVNVRSGKPVSSANFTAIERFDYTPTPGWLDRARHLPHVLLPSVISTAGVLLAAVTGSDGDRKNPLIYAVYWLHCRGTFKLLFRTCASCRKTPVGRKNRSDYRGCKYGSLLAVRGRLIRRQGYGRGIKRTHLKR